MGNKKKNKMKKNNKALMKTNKKNNNKLTLIKEKWRRCHLKVSCNSKRSWTNLKMNKNLNKFMISNFNPLWANSIMSIYNLNSTKISFFKINKINNKNLSNKKDLNSRALLLTKSDKKSSKKKDLKEKKEKTKWLKISLLKMLSKELNVKTTFLKQLKWSVIEVTKRKTEWTLITSNLDMNGDLYTNENKWVEGNDIFCFFYEPYDFL